MQIPNAVPEGADILGEDILAELPVGLYGRYYATVEIAGATISAAGADCIATLAAQLLRTGRDPAETLALYCRGDRVGRITIGAAAGVTNDA